MQDVEPEEARDLERRGSLEDFFRCADLGDASVEEHGDPVGELERVVAVVRDQDRRHAEASEQRREFAPDACPRVGVEGREGLVEQEELRLRDDRTRERDALLLAARELGRTTLRVAVEADARQRAGHARTGLLPAYPAAVEREADVRLDAEVGPEGVVLEHHAETAPLRRQRQQVAPAERHAPRRRLEHPRHRGQKRRLAGARGPEQRQQLAGADDEVRPFEGDDAAVAVVQRVDDEVGGHDRQLVSRVSCMGQGGRCFASVATATSRAGPPPGRCRSRGSGRGRRAAASRRRRRRRAATRPAGRSRIPGRRARAQGCGGCGSR